MAANIHHINNNITVLMQLAASLTTATLLTLDCTDYTPWREICPRPRPRAARTLPTHRLSSADEGPQSTSCRCLKTCMPRWACLHPLLEYIITNPLCPANTVPQSLARSSSKSMRCYWIRNEGLAGVAAE